MAQGTEVADALALEANEFTRAVSDGATQAEADVNAFKQEQAARGLARSGGVLIGEMEIRFNSIANGPIEKAIAKRKELGRRFPDLLTPDRLNDLRDKLHRHVDGVLKGQETRNAMGGGIHGAVLVPLTRQAQNKASAIKARIAQDLEALRLEARLGLRKEERPMTFNISNNTIASLNLGTVVG